MKVDSPSGLYRDSVASSTSARANRACAEPCWDLGAHITKVSSSYAVRPPFTRCPRVIRGNIWRAAAVAATGITTVMTSPDPNTSTGQPQPGASLHASYPTKRKNRPAEQQTVASSNWPTNTLV
ncbi:hypothetical protein [Streptomyces sp. SAS_276]|uniref:hypothetical protein n=1 Tax=Streptomyces sp. SAS_276 TaxID=3412745 RepID=UPI00403C2ECB